MYDEYATYSIRSQFSQWTRSQRETLAQLWQVATESRSLADIRADLLAHMAKPFYARFVWQHLSVPERRCLHSILAMPSAPKGVRQDTLPKKVRLTVADVQTAINRLVDQWFLLVRHEGAARAGTPRGGLAAIITTVLLTPLDDARASLQLVSDEDDTKDHFLQQSLFQLLEHHPDRHAFAERYQVAEPEPRYQAWSYQAGEYQQRRDRELTNLCKKLTTPMVVFAHLMQAPEDAQAVFRWLMDQPEGCADFDDARSALGTGRLQPRALEPLERHILVVDTLLRDGDRFLVIPPAIWTAAKAAFAAYQDQEQRYALRVQPTPKTIHAGQPLLLADLATVIHATFHQPLEPTKNGTLPKRLQEKLRPLVRGKPRGTEDTYLQQLLTLAMGLEVLHCVATYGAEKARYQPGEQYDAWCRMSHADQAQRILTWWQRAESWSDVTPKGQPVFPTSAGQQRRHILAILARCPTNQWYPVASLWYALWHEEVGHQLSLARRTSLTALPDLFDQWTANEGTVTVALLTSMLWELGIISLGYRSEQRADTTASPDLVAVTPLGAEVLTQIQQQDTTLHGSDPGKLLIVQPNFDIIAYSDTPALIYPLLPFCAIQHLDHTCTLRITQVSLLDGLKAGQRFDDFLAFLHEHAQHALAQNVLYTLREWAARFRGTTLTEVVLVELAFDMTEAELHEAVSMPLLDLRWLAPRLFALTRHPALSLADVTRQFERAGIAVHWHRATTPNET